MISYKGKSKRYCSVLKYGHIAVRLDILEYCNKENTIDREQYYINTLNPEYNILKIAGSRLGLNHSELTKLKISINNTREKNPFYCQKDTKEYKLKMSLSSKSAETSCNKYK